MKVTERAGSLARRFMRRGTESDRALKEAVLRDLTVEVLLNPDKPKKFAFIKRNLDILRDKNTPREVFKASADRLFRNLGAHLAERLTATTTEAQTPTGATFKKETVDNSGILLVSILRSGLPMVQGIADALPGAHTAMVDMKRVEETDPKTGEITCKPCLNYDGLPDDLSGYKEVWVPDPMLATGGSTEATIEMLLAKKALEENIHIIALVSAAEGILKIREKYPKVKIITCALDEGLNEKKYIVPGLGDFGDRYYEPDIDIEDERKGFVIHYRNNKYVNTTPLVK